MSSIEAAGGSAPGMARDRVEQNVSEIFPGASLQAPVENPPFAAGASDASGARGQGWAQAGMEAGMATAEYAIATLAAVGFAGLLVVILKSDEVRGFLMNIIRTALSF